MVEVFVLGGGTPTPTEFRFGSAHALRIGDEVLMFDCGPAATHKLVKAGLYPTQVDNLFFTHHHFDHNIDYPCFLLCRWDQAAGKGQELNVYGPKLTEEITQKVIGVGGAFESDWQARINLPGSQRVFVNRGGTILMSTHTLEVAQEMCDRISIIVQGKIIACGTVDELRQMADSPGEQLTPIFLKLTGGSALQEIDEVI